MRKLLLSFALIGLLAGLAACADHEPPRSPCVGLETSPCDWRNPVKNS